MYAFLFLLFYRNDIITNPGPVPGYLNSFSFCHWNVKSIVTHDFIKMFLLQVCNSVHTFGIIWLSKTYLDNSGYSGDDQIALPGYNLIIPDKSKKTKGRVCIYYSKILPVKVINMNILNECLFCELSEAAVST